jgi:hypothetical protein
MFMVKAFKVILRLACIMMLPGIIPATKKRLTDRRSKE